MDQGTPERMATLLGRDDAERARFCSLPGVRVQARMSDIGIASQWLDVAGIAHCWIPPNTDIEVTRGYLINLAMAFDGLVNVK